MGTKLVENIDDDIWRQFVGYCVAKNVKVGDELNTILQQHIKQKR